LGLGKCDADNTAMSPSHSYILYPYFYSRLEGEYCNIADRKGQCFQGFSSPLASNTALRLYCIGT
jgi:hypothetical protein